MSEIDVRKCLHNKYSGNNLNICNITKHKCAGYCYFKQLHRYKKVVKEIEDIAKDNFYYLDSEKKMGFRTNHTEMREYKQ